MSVGLQALSALLLATLLSACAPDSPDTVDCTYELADAREVKLPSHKDRVAYEAWSYAAHNSPLNWQLHAVKGRVCAMPVAADFFNERVAGERPGFEPQAGEPPRLKASRFARVDDGWLVAFNGGEWGAALYWFSPDGQRSYRVSTHQVAQFLRYADSWAAIEGLNHEGFGKASIIRITFDKALGRWQARTTLTLPATPVVALQMPSGRLLVVLSNALVSVEGLQKQTVLLDEAPWEFLRPRNAALTADARTLYIGMSQYVAAVDLRTSKLRILLPRGAEQHRLSAEDERQIRAIYGR